MKKLFIMTIRKDQTQMKLSVENGKCIIRIFRTYPYSDRLLRESIVSEKHFIHVVTANMSDNLSGFANVNIYFKGYNYKKFMSRR